MRNNLDHNAPPKLPAWIWGAAVLGIVASWLPLALIARSRAVKTERQPVHMFLDMDFQPRYSPQDYQDESLPVRFSDGRAMRPPVPGTIRHDGGDPTAPLDSAHYDHFNFGYKLTGEMEPVMVEATVAGAKVQQPAYFDDFPPNVEITEKFLERGRERYNIYCSVCHGRGGYGDGPVHNRVMQRQALTPSAIVGWVEPRNFHIPDMAAMPVGKIYDRITRGVYSVDPATGKTTYTMWPYAAQLDPRDRWAVVAYIRVLQMSQYYPAGALPADLKSRIDPKAPRAKHPAVGAGGSAFKVTEAELDDPALIAEGKKQFVAKTCFTCHETKEFGPGAAGLALKAPKYTGKFWGTERRVHLGVNPDLTPKREMATVTFGPEYFYESVKTPMAKIAEGTTPGMVVPFPVNDDEIKALMAYVRSLSEK